MQSIQQISTQPLLMNVTQTAKALGLSRGKVYQLIRQEGLPVVYFGRKMAIIPGSLQLWLQSREQQS